MSEYDDMYRIMVDSNNLGVHFCKRGGYQMAIMFHIQALKIAETIMGTLSEDYCDSLYNIGNTFADAGNYGMAVRYLQIARQHSLLRGADSDMKMVHLLNSIAYALEEQGDYTEAIEYLESALAMLRRLAGGGRDTGTDEELLRNIYYLAGVYEKAEKHTKALAYYSDALRLIKRCKITYYPSCLNNIANQLTALGDFTRSVELRVEAMAQIKETIGANSISYAQSLRNVAVMHQQLGELGRAKELLLDAIRIKRAVLGITSKETIREELLLVDLYAKLGEADNACEWFARLLEELDTDADDYDDMLREITKIYSSFGDINYLNRLFNGVMGDHGDLPDDEEAKD